MYRFRTGKRLTAAAAGVLLGLTGPAAAFTGAGVGAVTVMADDNGVLDQLHTVRSLIDSDFEKNAAAVSIMLEQIMSGVEEGTPVYQSLQSAKVLADAGGADGTAVRILIDKIIDALGGTEENSGQKEETPAEEEQAGDEQLPAEDIADGEQPEDGSSEETAGDAASEEDADTDDAVTASELETRQRTVTEGLPPYQVMRYLLTALNSSVAVQVPADWGNNGTDSTLVTYSPANESGAITSSAGTLNTSYSVMPAADVPMSFEEFVANIEKMSIVSDVSAEEATAAGCTAKRITYNMNLGANIFYCETVCLAYEDNLYWIDIMQGNKSDYDYFPVFDAVVASLDTDDAAVREGESGDVVIQNGEVAETGGAEETGSGEDETGTGTEEQPGGAEEVGTGEDETGTGTEEQPGGAEETGTGEDETGTGTEEQPGGAEEVGTGEGETGTGTEEQPGETEEVGTGDGETGTGTEEQPGDAEEVGTGEGGEIDTGNDEPIPVGRTTEESADLASFTYSINGVTYQFPTALEAMDTSLLPLDLSETLPAVSRGNAADVDAALSDTQFYRYTTDIYMELIGVTNLTGRNAEISEGVVTQLVDTQGDRLDLTLPGNVRIGEPVINLITSFPQFMNVSLDGEAVYRDDDTIYAANYREDGCYGYVIIKNNAPYYSALSIVCDNGTIREISFECLGAAQMARFF